MIEAATSSTVRHQEDVVSDQELELNFVDLSIAMEIEDITMRIEACNPSAKYRKCLVCALQELQQLNQHGTMYTSSYIAYKFVLTLSCTQVACERVFSILKIVKSRLRS